MGLFNSKQKKICCNNLNLLFQNDVFNTIMQYSDILTMYNFASLTIEGRNNLNEQILSFLKIYLKICRELNEFKKEKFKYSIYENYLCIKITDNNILLSTFDYDDCPKIDMCLLRTFNVLGHTIGTLNMLGDIYYVVQKKNIRSTNKIFTTTKCYLINVDRFAIITRRNLSIYSTVCIEHNVREIEVNNKEINKSVNINMQNINQYVCDSLFKFFNNSVLLYIESSILK